ncbi:hypothetical protein D0Z00_000679 [Geotrichum galactomycetum]|uniref:Uncharacterized protein n=1 Tax=Geotrichum galactomycetum TaxID=27317 RepID=A0ACB6V943_9ASCO|nr:hypothetical protein D0Z00_000679 [Geotrichum candidum]
MPINNTASSKDESHPDLATVQALLGPEITSWNFSDESLKAALALRTEQERTKQEKYKLDIRTKTSELLTQAIKLNVPPNMLPSLFNGSPPLGDAFYQQHQQQNQQSQQQQLPQQPPPGQFQSNFTTPQTFASSQKNPPFDALGLVPASASTRERYQHHQRNLSLPQPPTTVSFDYKYPPPPQQQPQQPHQLQHVSPPQPPQQQPSQFRPSHSHHASLSSIPYFTSPTRSPYPSSQRVYPYQQQQQHTLPNNVGSTSVHQIIQFHHWQPNQQSQKSSASTSPKKETATLAATTASDDQQSSAKRRRSSISTDQPLSPTPNIKTKAQTPPSSSTNSNAIASALARRKSTHSRNKSETTVLRGDISKMSLYSTESTPTNTVTSGSGSSSNLIPDGTPAGFNFLASVAAEESRKIQDSAAAGKLSSEFKYPPRSATSSDREEDEHMADAAPHQEHQRSHKQNVNFMISDKPE